MSDIPAPAVFMVVPGHFADGQPQYPTFVQSQIAALVECGVTVHLGLFAGRTNPLEVICGVRRLREAFRQSGAELIHAQYGTITALAASYIAGSVPLIISLGGSDILGIPVLGLHWRLRGALGKRFSFWAGARATALIVKSQNLFDALPAHFQKKTHILPNGVNTAVFSPLPKEACRSRLGWKTEERIVVLYASGDGGDNQYIKNVPLAEAAVRLAEREIGPIRFEVFHGYPHAAVAELLNAADMLLMTSVHEGSPNIVKEAMACNLPVVTVRCGDVAERLEGVTPGGVYPYDAAELAKGIIAVMIAGRRSNGRQQLESQGLTAANVTRKLISLYSSLVPRPS
jgi:teichuronic acid biosynthesis glycosyltransferase TuaC